MTKPRTEEGKAEKERQAAQAKANADHAVRLLRQQEVRYLRDLWNLRLAVLDEITNVGESEDDEQQAETQRAQRMAGYKVSWCVALSELRGCRYKMGEESRKADDPACPAWLTNVAVGPDDEDMVRDLLHSQRRRAAGDGHPTPAQQTAAVNVAQAA